MNNRLKIKEILNKIFRWLRNIALLLFALSLFWVLLYKYVPVYYTVPVFSKKTEQFFKKEKTPVKHRWKPLAAISQNLVQAVIASEDNLFPIHNGFEFNDSEVNPDDISRSRYKRKNGTISQQTARAVFLFPGRNYLNKILENYFTILIEFVWGKERIIEVYLNSAAFGADVFGAEAVAGQTFQISASELTVCQAALIAVSISNPEELDSAHPTTYMLRRQAKIISLMEKMIPIEFGTK